MHSLPLSAPHAALPFSTAARKVQYVALSLSRCRAVILLSAQSKRTVCDVYVTVVLYIHVCKLFTRGNSNPTR